MKLTFKSKKEFAEAILNHGKLWLSDGTYVFFYPTMETPFRFRERGQLNSAPMDGLWNAFNQEWSTEEPLKHLDLVWAWDDDATHSRSLGIWDESHGTIFSSIGERGLTWENFKKYTGEPPQWYLDTIKPKEDK